MQQHRVNEKRLGATILTFMDIPLFDEDEDEDEALEAYEGECAYWTGKKWEWITDDTDVITVFAPLHSISSARKLVDWLLGLDPQTNEQHQARLTFYMRLRAYNEWVHPTKEVCEYITIAFLESFGYTLQDFIDEGTDNPTPSVEEVPMYV